MERVGESASGGEGTYTLIRWKGWGEVLVAVGVDML